MGKMFGRVFKITLLSLLLSIFMLSAVLVAAEEDCNTRKECEALLEKYEADIKELEGVIGQTEQEKKTLQNQINALRSKVQQLDLQIQQGNVMIKDLGYQIDDTEASIEQISLKVEDLRSKLANILQTIGEQDQQSIVEVLLAGKTLSDFFDNLMALESLNFKSQELLSEIKDFKITLEEQIQTLDGEKRDLERIVQLQYLQKQQSQTTKQEQESLLRMTEAQYQQYLKEKEVVEKAADEIRAKIVDLIGIPIGEAPEFGELLEIAEDVAKVVGIRPAFLLGIISQESALGRNIGQCYVTNSQTGGGVYIGSNKPVNRIMHATRDLPIFLRIAGDNFSQMPVSCWIPICYSTRTSYLSLTYNNISVSSTGNIICPAGYAPYGFGGAMGPAQFIPSTWKMYESRLTSLFKINKPNPWNVKDALAASSLYLSELGATNKTRANEIAAANRYFGSSYSSYGNQVIQRADCVQSFIDNNSMSQACQNLLGLRLR